jgi:hypothetical protein
MRGKNTAKRVPRLREAATEAPPPLTEESDHQLVRRRFTFWPSPVLGPLKLPSDLALSIVAEQVDETSRGFIRQCEHSIGRPPWAVRLWILIGFNDSQ